VGSAYSCGDVAPADAGRAPRGAVAAQAGCGDLKPFSPPPRGKAAARAITTSSSGAILDDEAKLVAYWGTIVYDLDRRMRGREWKRHDRKKADGR
jgi:hypothetical protein